ncbi:MAG TPA: hypothetical protein VN223_03315, partial [Candidatus Elarobacter sp.]|nr:hypothetical protein [Candidatus Elarobacter sp.]
IAMLVFLLALLLSQTAQLIFVRRAFPGTIAFGTPLFRVALYYVCVLLVVAATLPNWYVPPIVRHENKSVDSLRGYSSATELYAATSKDEPHPLNSPELNAPEEGGKRLSIGMLHPGLNVFFVPGRVQSLFCVRSNLQHAAIQGAPGRRGFPAWLRSSD